MTELKNEVINGEFQVEETEKEGLVKKVVKNSKKIAIGAGAAILAAGLVVLGIVIGKPGKDDVVDVESKEVE